MPDHDMVLKTIEPMLIASARAVVPTVQEMPDRCRALAEAAYSLIAAHELKDAGPCFAMYYNESYSGQDIDVEMAVPVAGVVPIEDPGAQAAFLRLPGASRSASCRRRDDPGGYGALGHWIEANGYRINGPCREIYVRGPEEGTPVTEIQSPVERICTEASCSRPSSETGNAGPVGRLLALAPVYRAAPPLWITIVTVVVDGMRSANMRATLTQ